jgi:hypothetical protein
MLGITCSILDGYELRGFCDLKGKYVVYDSINASIALCSIQKFCLYLYQHLQDKLLWIHFETSGNKSSFHFTLTL